MIKYYTDKRIDYNKLIVLFNQVGWNDKIKQSWGQKNGRND